MPSNKRMFTLRLHDDVYEKIGRLAYKNHRSMTNYIEYILINHIKDMKAMEIAAEEEESKKNFNPLDIRFKET